MSVYEIISITVAVIGITTAAIGIFTFSIRTRQSREEVISASIINLVIIAIVTVASMILFISTTIPILITHTFSSNHSFLLFGVFIVIAFIAFVGAFIIFQIVYQSRLVDKLEQNERNVQNFKREYEADKVRRVEEYREKIRNDELLRTTQRNIRNDLRTKKVQIIDMSSPLSMEDVYIPLKLQKLEETIRPLNLDGTQLGEAEAMHDPNALLEQIKAIRRRFDDHPNAVLNADQAIREHKHCIIVGDPGSGKTTLLKYLVLQSAKGELEGLPNLPIHVHLNEFAYYKGSDDLLDFALSKWDERYGLAKEETSVHLQEHLAAGNVLFLLDAIDEVGIGTNAKQSSERVSKAIMQLAETYKESYIVITARKAGYEQQQTSLTGFTELEVLCFSAEDIRTFVNNWFDTQESETREANASDLNIKLENNLRIQTLASNPLLLSLIVMLYEKELKLPDRRAELYKQCVEMLLSKWDVSRGIYRQSEFTIERKRQLLKHVAWTCHEKRRFFFPKRELLNTIADYLLMAGEKDTRDELLPKAEQVLDEIAIENGLLKEHSTDFYGFLHLSVQEYFVALHALEKEQLNDLVRYRLDPWWEEVTLLYAAYAPDTSPLLQKLVGPGGEAEDIFLTNLILAGRCLSGRPTIQHTSLRRSVVNSLFDELLKTPSYSLTRDRIAAALVEISEVEIGEQLWLLLKDRETNRDVRQSIVDALGQLGERSNSGRLLDLLINESHMEPEVRHSIAKAVGKLGGLSLAKDLFVSLRNRSLAAGVRINITEALGEVRESSVARDLLKALSDNQIPDPSVLWSIADALGRLGEQSVTPDLVSLLSSHRIYWDVRKRIAEALGELGNHSVTSSLLPLLSDQQLEIQVRWSIAETLGKLGNRSVVPDLRKLFSDEQTDLSLRGHIAVTLCVLGERSVIAEMMHMLANPQLGRELRVHIARTLGTLKDRSISHRLLQMLPAASVDKFVRMSMARFASVFGQQDKSSFARDLLRLLSDDQIDPYVRQCIAVALGKTGEHWVVPKLLRLLTDEQVDQDTVAVRISIATVIGKLADNEKTVRELVTLLQRSDMPFSITDEIHRALWKICRRITIKDELMKEIKDPKQRTESNLQAVSIGV